MRLVIVLVSLLFLASGAGAAVPEVPDLGIAPVRCLEFQALPGGPDFYQFDWPVDPGQWPLVKAGILRYPVGVWGYGSRPGPGFETQEDWWRGSGFDFGVVMANVPEGMGAERLAALHRQYSLDPAARAGGKIIFNPSNVFGHLGPQGMQRFAELVADHPALRGWDPMDEPGPGERAQEWADIYRMLRQSTPDKLILLNGVPGYQWQQHILPLIAPEKPDIFSCDAYPVQGGHRLGNLIHWCLHVASESRKRGVDSMFIIGTFDHNRCRLNTIWPWEPLSMRRRPWSKPGAVRARFSTPAEQRNQVYQAVIAGIQSLQWFNHAIWDSGSYPRKYNYLYEEQCRLNYEVHQLSGPIYSTLRVPVYAEGEQGKRLDECDFPVRASVYRDALYIIVACVAEEEEPQVPVKQATARLVLSQIPEVYRSRLGEEAEVLLEVVGQDETGHQIYYQQAHGAWRKVALDRENWILDDTFGPYGVHVYRIPLSADRRE